MPIAAVGSRVVISHKIARSRNCTPRLERLGGGSTEPNKAGVSNIHFFGPPDHSVAVKNPDWNVGRAWDYLGHLGERVNRRGGKTADGQLMCSSPDMCRRNHSVS
jgi:hypothetical protein